MEDLSTVKQPQDMASLQELRNYFEIKLVINSVFIYSVVKELSLLKLERP